MGAWGAGPFENDDARDFVYSVDKSRDLGVLEASFEAALNAGVYLEAPQGAEVIASAEILAIVLGRAGEKVRYPDEIITWAAKTKTAPSPALVAKALSALDAVLGESSELRELWQDSDEFDTWKSGVDDVKRRLA